MIDFGVLPATDYDDRDQDHEYQLPVKRDPFDPAALIRLFDRYHHQIDAMASTASALVISDDISAAQAAEYTTQAKKLAHTLDKRRQEEKAPYLAVTSVLDKAVKAMTDRLAGVQHEINRKLQPFLQEKQRKADEARRQAEAEARALQAKLDAEAAEQRRLAAEQARLDALRAGQNAAAANMAASYAAAMVEDAPVVVAPMIPDVVTGKAENGTVGLKTEWTFEVIDIRQLPDRCLDERKEQIVAAVKPWISAQVKAGIRNIPGCRVFEKTEVKTRLK